MTEPCDAIELLIQDHREIGQLLEQLDAATDPDGLRLLYLRLVGLLSAHEAAEEQVLFPAFRSAFPASGQQATDRVAEHEEVNELLTGMNGLAADSLGFDKRTSAVIVQLQNHFEDEEQSVFSYLQTALSHDQLMAMAGRIEAVKRQASASAEPDRAPAAHRVAAD
jgi:hemerythrin superfamily protein